MEERTLGMPGVEDPDLDLQHLDSVPTPPAWKVVADNLRGKIKQGAYLPGEKLPAERQLAAQLGVSRVTVREALRRLEGERLIAETGRSTSGGPEVLLPPRPSDEERKKFWRELPKLFEILDCRMALEAFGASWAAQNRASEHIKVLDESVGEMEEASEALQSLLRGASEAAESTEEADLETREAVEKAAARGRHADSAFHRTVAAAARNSELLHMVEELRTKVFTPVTLEVLYGSGDRQDAAYVREALSEHRKILEAIRAKNETGAYEAMREHVNSTKKALELVAQSLKGSGR